jgi:O-antigen/teichoic acid export membrane protein
MRSRLLWRRSTTALGIYSSVVLGVLGTLLAARWLGPTDFGLLSIVLVTTGFFQSFLDLTVEEALVKYGFRYSTAEDWGRLHRLFRRALAVKWAGGLLAAAAMLVMAPIASTLFNHGGLEVPFVIAAIIPLAQAPEALASAALILRGRYDVRGGFLTLSQGLRLAALAIGSRYGVTEAVVGLAAAQVVSTTAVGSAGLAAFRRFPRAAPTRLGSERRSLLGFVAQSSLATTILSLRGAVGPMLLGIVTGPVQVSYFRTAQAPQQGFASLTAPARLILLTEQTRDWEHGKPDAVFAGIRRYTIAGAVLMAVAVPPLWVFMPTVIRILYGSQYSGAVDAARIILLAAALQLVVGWSKSFPVSIGRPGLRVVSHGIEAAVFIPLVIVLGSIWAAAGAAGAVLGSTVVFVAVWAVLLVRIRRDPRPVVPAAKPAPSEALLL